MGVHSFEEHLGNAFQQMEDFNWSVGFQNQGYMLLQPAILICLFICLLMCCFLAG